jgi:hypothetical protein
MKIIKKLLIMSAVLFFSTILLISNLNAALCKACNTPVTPNPINLGDPCKFVRIINNIAVEYTGTYDRTVAFIKCGNASLWNTCTNKEISKYVVCNGTTTVPNVPTHSSNGGYIIKEACE